MSSSAVLNERDHSAAQETTPLLAASAAGPTAQANEEALVHKAVPKDDDDKPLPKAQIFLLCYARLVEPIAFFSIFPFVNQMIWETGHLTPGDVGFYSGLIESLFSLTQMLVMISWGRAADRFGRKPVLVSSLAGVGMATSIFGLSKAIWQMILFRCLAGVFAGTIVTVRSMITENSTPRTQARAFSFFAFAGNLGIFIGPLIGGGLSKPAEQYPSVFGRIKLFKDFPYALPTFAAGAVGASAAIINALFVKETLNRKVHGGLSGDGPRSTWEIVKSPGVVTVLFIYGGAMLLALAYTAVLPVLCFTPVELGGFGFSPLRISILMATGGASQAIWLLLVFPPLQHRFGTGGVLRGCAIAWPFMFAIWPLCNELLRHDHTVAFWIVGPINLVLGSGVAMAFSKLSFSAALSVAYVFCSCRTARAQRYCALAIYPRNA
jgi:MFS family permease